MLIGGYEQGVSDYRRVPLDAPPDVSNLPTDVMSFAEASRFASTIPILGIVPAGPPTRYLQPILKRII